jgi:hypothetical protein
MRKYEYGNLVMTVNPMAALQLTRKIFTITRVNKDKPH